VPVSYVCEKCGYWGYVALEREEEDKDDEQGE
jgi:hypothetical protein